MKTFWSWSAKLLVVVVIAQAWFLYDLYKRNELLSQLNDEYAANLTDSESRIAKLQSKLEETEKKTVEGILDETNKAVIAGWESLLDKVQAELENARKTVPEVLEELNPKQDKANPDEESKGGNNTQAPGDEPDFKVDKNLPREIT